MVEFESILVVLSIVLLGAGLSGILEKASLRIYRRSHKTQLENPPIVRLLSTILFLLFALSALSYLQISIEFARLDFIIALIPVVSILLLLILTCVLLTRLIIVIIDLIIKKSGLYTLIEGYNQVPIHKFGRTILGLFIFLFFFGQALSLAGYETSTYVQIIQFITYPALLLFFLFVFIAFKDVVREIGIGFYFRYSESLRPGQYVKSNDKEHKIKTAKLTGVITEAESELSFMPYHKLLIEGYTTKKTKSPLETLDDIKNQYVSQHPSYCGPASSSIILKMFGFEFSQDEIGAAAKTEVSKNGELAGTKPQDLINAVEKLTKKKVKGAWIDADHIVDLRNEVKSWLNDDALLIVDYKKSYLFPKAQKAHYSVCLGVNGDELLILDPSSTAGGVFYADYRKILAGMDTFSALFNGKRGYIVFALDGTPAYKRIEDDIIYFGESMYHKVTKKVTIALADLEEKTKDLEKIFPKRLSNLVTKEKISRLWKPN